ncbi:MAG: hypothetical protein JEZ04_05885 [Spirochaetales bacterium]|nr:hypothetical protein [Spirochaetales bacterium]
MTDKNILKSTILILIISAVLVFSGCGAASSNLLTVAEKEAFEDYVMSSYFILRGDDALAVSRTAWDYTVEVILPTDIATPTTATSVNYPEKGQKTVVTITKTATLNVFKVSNLTTYPNRDSINNSLEVYYILNDGDTTYDTGDEICTSDGTVDPLARESFVTTFADGTTREEKINAVLGTGITTGYAEFDINGDLTFPTPDADGIWTPPEGAAEWSSMVIYEQVEGNTYSLWSSYKNIMGVRYYTEQGSGSSLVRTAVTYERMITRDADTLSAMDNLTAFIGRLFSSDPGSNTVYTGETLTETVIRTRLSGNKKKQMETNSTVFDTGGSAIINFTASYETADDGTVISTGAPVAVYY